MKESGEKKKRMRVISYDGYESEKVDDQHLIVVKN